MKTIYVSCEHGNDAWSGTLPAPNAEGTDGPLQSLTAAQTAVRMVKRDLAAPEVIEVVLRGGCYRLEKTWRLSEGDSGYGFRKHYEGHTWPLDGHTWPVTWRAAKDEAVTISGGRPLEGWQTAIVNGRTVWRASVPWLTSDALFFRQLWINGARRPRVRLPKTGTYRVAASPDASFADAESYQRGTQAFEFRPGDFSAAWSNVRALDVQFRGLWLNPRLRVLAIDEAQSTVRLDRYSQLRLVNGPGDGLDYIIENVLEALSEPGEWCLDPAARCVWYLPRPGEQPETSAAVVGGLERLLELRDVQFLAFEQIHFAHCEWNPEPSEAMADQPGSQAAARVPGAVSVGRGCLAVSFEGCRIEHVSCYGFECVDGATEVAFRNGVIQDLGAGGAKIWHGCRRCVLEGCEIGDGGHLWLSGVGVLIGRASGNAVRRCHIHDFYYSGVSVGWNWGYCESEAYGNVVEWNHIHDLGKGLLSDMGGVYTLGPSSGTRVRHNRIHDIRSLRYGGWAIYPDEGSSDLLIENNLCYNTDREVFHQHYGRNNLVRNNIFAYGGDAVLAYSRNGGEQHCGLIFEQNIFLSRREPIVRRVDAERWCAKRTRFASNLYWCEEGAVQFEGGWRNLGTQPFLGRMLDEAPRFEKLPGHGTTLHTLFEQGKPDVVVSDAGTFQVTHDGCSLTVTGQFHGSIGPKDASQPPWGDWRAHMELFLKPFALVPAMVRLIVTADGADSIDWFGCAAPPAFTWQRAQLPATGGWAVTATVSLAAIEDWVRSACGITDMPVGWRSLFSVALPIPSMDITAWKAHSGDQAGVVADPLFRAPHAGDFRLSPHSPALGIGFVPFACGGEGAGVRC
jgi:hypothetical protein